MKSAQEKQAALPFWNLSAEEALRHMNSGQTGLTEAQASHRLRQYGANLLSAPERFGHFALLFRQFKSPISALLIIAAILAAILRDTADASIILIILLISGLLGFWQERGAANAMKKLQALVQLRAKVWRNGALKEIPVSQLVPGDIVHLNAGNLIPADCRLIDLDELSMDEAAFTGESFPVEKSVALVPADTAMQGRLNMLWMGTHVISGKARALVVQTGAATALGHVSSDLQTTIPLTDFEQGIRRFGYMLMEITLLLVIIIFAINVFLHKPVVDSFLFSLALAVGLTPQLLPAIVSVNLAAGARRMAGNKVIVKRLAAIQDFGAMTVLCSDKTGTITEGRIRLVQTINAEGLADERIAGYARINAHLQQAFVNPIDEAICRSGAAPEGYTLVDELPYDFTRKRLSVLVRNGNQDLLISKGAFENILICCEEVEMHGAIMPIAGQKDALVEKYRHLSSSGLRVLGLASKITQGVESLHPAQETGLVFLGFLTFADPPKAGIQATISGLRQKGVELKIVTGDNPYVAGFIARQIGLNDEHMLTGEQISKLSKTQLQHRVNHVSIFASVEPDHKERIIEALKARGQVVGYLGDGINDAPALHAAHVGISVNTAVDVAKEAADIVLLDQDLDVLQQGIMAGRRTFANTMKYIFMATSANFGNMFSMAGASVMLSFLPLLPKQILLTNLLTDLPEMAIATDLVDNEALHRPKHWDLRFIRRFMVVFGILSSVFDYLTFMLLRWAGATERLFQTGWFTESVCSASLIVLVIRSKRPFFKSLPSRWLTVATLVVNTLLVILPFTIFAKWFSFTILPLRYWTWLLAIIIFYLLSGELLKRWFFRVNANN